MKKLNRFNAIVFAFALLVVMMGLAFVWIGGQVSRLSCTRLAGRPVECQLQRYFLGLLPTGRRALPPVTGSEVKEDCLDGCRYWIELRTGAGPVRLTTFSSYNRSGVRADQKRIEAFLHNPELKLFEHAGSPSWAMLVTSTPLLGVGGFLAMSYGKELFKT